MAAKRDNQIDAAEFEAVYRAHFPFVWRSLSRLGVPDRDLPDAAQDVFLVVHNKLANFDYEHQLTTWIYAICLRVASDRRRRAHVRREVLCDEHTEIAAGEDAGDTHARTDLRALLEKALATLPMEQRAVFTLFELDGMTGDEIATLLSIPLATVHSRLRLARASVRRVLDRARAVETFSLAKLGGTA